MEEFFTREVANEGVRLPLHTPDGKETEQWLLVRGVDSDEFRLVEAREKRNAARLADDPESVDWGKVVVESQRRLIASLVAGWSFEKECTPENVFEFLRQAPQIETEINRLAGRRANFFGKRSSSSASTPEASST